MFNEILIVYNYDNNKSKLFHNKMLRFTQFPNFYQIKNGK